MGDILGLIIFAFVLSAVFNGSRKQQTKQKPPSGFPTMDADAPKAVVTQPAASHPATMLPPRPEVTRPGVSTEGRRSPHSREGVDPCHEDQLRPAVRPARVAPATLGKTIDFKEEKPAVELKFTGDELVRAVIMQEVLTRPCERNRRTI